MHRKRGWVGCNSSTYRKTKNTQCKYTTKKPPNGGNMVVVRSLLRNGIEPREGLHDKGAIGIENAVSIGIEGGDVLRGKIG